MSRAKGEGSRPPEDLRRKDRGVDDSTWLREFLARTPVGVLATVADGQPFLNSNLFVYDPVEQVIFVHTARTGRTRDNVERDNRASFAAFEMGRLLPDKRALEFSVEYAGVVAFGTVEVVGDAAEARHALQLIMDKYAPHLRPGADYETPTEADLARTSVFRLSIEAWSGKRKAVAADFPGAYRFEEVRPPGTD